MAKASKGLSPKIYQGLNKKRMEKGTGGVRTVLKQGDTITAQFLTGPDGMREYDEHQFQDQGRWNYVPCAGENCPLCADDDQDVAKIHYKFIANIWNFKTKKVEVLSGPKDLSGRISFRYETLVKKAKQKTSNTKKAMQKATETFLTKTWDISKFPTTPVSYDVEASDDDPIVIGSKHKPHDLDEYIAGELKRYFGDNLPKSGGKSALDDDDDDAEDDGYDEDDLEEMSTKEVKAVAKGLGIKTVNPKTDEPRSKATLIKLIIKKQS